MLFVQYRPGWMHLLATVKYPRVMCFKNCLCLFPTGSFQGNSEERWLLFVVNEGCGAVASGSLGAVLSICCPLCSVQGWMYLHATVRSPREMCLTNCLCLVPNGLFEDNNLVYALMNFMLGKLWRLAYVCALAFCPATHSRHRRA